MDVQLVLQRISISYFDPFEVFENVKGEFFDALQLKNIHWKTPNGAVRTIEKLEVTLRNETKAAKREEDDIKYFMRLIVVNCISIDEYRAKVRPLIKKWLPYDDATMSKTDLLNSPMPLVLFYSNTDVLDSNLFKSVSLMDKFSKDFPNVTTLELRSVYKSQKEKQEFWSQLNYQLKRFVMNIFHSRLDYFQKKLDNLNESSENLESAMKLREKLVELYLLLNMPQQVEELLDSIEGSVRNNVNFELLEGPLDNPLEDIWSPESEPDSIAGMISKKTLTNFQFEKYLFITKLELLLGATSSTVKVLKLYRLLRGYLRQMENLYKYDKNWLLFKFEFLSKALNFLPTENSLEVRAELLLARRDCWIEGVHSSSGLMLEYMQFPKTDVAYSFEKYSETFATEDSFYNNYLTFTKEILSLYNRCDGRRQRIVDILSVEIGCFYYQRQEYEKAVSIFLSCHEYYMQSKWDLIGKNILKTFVDSLMKCPHLTHLNIDEESIPVTTVLGNALLHIMKLSDNPVEKKIWCNKFFSLRYNEMSQLIFPMGDLFNVSILNNVHQTTSYTYALNIIIDNCGVPKDLAVDTIKLILKNNSDDFVSFELFDIMITESRKKYTLESRDIRYGSFLPISLEFRTEGTIFTQEFKNEVEMWVEIPPLYNPMNVSFTVAQARELNLEENMLEVLLTNIEYTDTFELELVAINSGRHPTALVSFDDNKMVSSIRFDNDSFKCKIPYFLKEPCMSFDIKAKLSFVRKDQNKSFSEEMIFPIDCHLPISVSVEDIFKKELFIFKFLINSSIFDEPMILHSSRLLPPEDVVQYEISGAYIPESFEYLTTDPDKYCLNCYQIKTKDRFDHSHIFHLEVSYNSLKKQLDQLVTDAVLIRGDLEWYRHFEVWKTFWEFFVVPQLHYDYENFQRSYAIVLEKENFELKDLESHIKRLAIEDVVRDRMLQCLKDITDGVQLSEIDIDAYTKNLSSRTLILPVGIPKVEQLFYVNLKKNQEPPLQVGMPIAFNIEIEKVRDKWGQVNQLGSYIAELLNSNEWLVHGKKRTRLVNDFTILDIKMIPLKKGFLTLPRIDITNIESGELARIDNSSSSETILVL